MKKIDVVTIGSAVKDIMFYSDEITIMKGKELTRQKLIGVEYGAKIELDNVYVNYGGGAMNVAVGLKNFGLSVAPMVNLGKDWVGQEFYYFMKDKGLNTSLISIDHEHTTGFSVILTAAKDKEHTIFTYKGSSRFLKISPIQLRKIEPKWFFVTALSVPNWAAELGNVIDYAAKIKAKVGWNPGGKQLKDFRAMKKILPAIDLLIINKDEAIELVLNTVAKKVEIKKLNQLRYLLDQIHELGAKNVVITAGPRGAYGLDEEHKYYFHKSEAKKIVDTVGAGDAFASGFLAGMVSYRDFQKALLLGIRNSAGVLTEIGAQNGLLEIKLK